MIAICSPDSTKYTSNVFKTVVRMRYLESIEKVPINTSDAH